MCAVESFGWYEVSSATLHEAVVKDDFRSIPPEVSADITEESVAQCTQQWLDGFANNKLVFQFLYFYRKIIIKLSHIYSNKKIRIMERKQSSSFCHNFKVAIDKLL